MGIVFMKALKKNLLLLIGVIILVDYGRRVYLFSDPHLRAAYEQIKVVGFYTNGVHGVGVVERKSGYPVYVEWDFSHQGKADEISFCFRGTNMFNVNLETNRPPIYETIFYKNGKKHVSWLNQGASGMFTGRIFWDETGHKVLTREVWFQQAWHQTVVGPNGKGGLLVHGQWHALRFTNDEWIVAEEQGSERAGLKK